VKVWILQWKRKAASLIIVSILAFLTGLFIKAPRALEHYILKQWEESAAQVDVIIGYKGSPIQIVASTLYRLENPTGNIPESTYTFWRSHPLVELATPVALGDNVEGHPLVGTDSTYYQWFQMPLKIGRYPENSGEVIVDVDLANQLEIKVGSSLISAHGSDSRGESHDHPLTVVGIVEASRNVDKAALFTLPQTYWSLHHSAEHSYTSVMLKLKSKSAMLMLSNVINNRANEQGAFPVFIFGQLQKQWQPTIDLAGRWSWIIAFAVILLFIAYITSLFNAERNTIAFLQNHRRSRSWIFIQVFGNVLLLTFLGFVFAEWAIKVVIGVQPVLQEILVMLFTLISAVSLLWIKLKKS